MQQGSQEQTAHPITAFVEVDATLMRLTSGLKKILQDNLFGLYLYGSLATGDFHALSSDIDFLVVSKTKLKPQEIEALRLFHAALYASDNKWDARLEGSYMPLEDLYEYIPGKGPYPSVNEGRFYLDQPGSQWVIHRSTLRRDGVTVHGPSIKKLIRPISGQQLKQAQAKILQEKWIPRLRDNSFLRSPNDASYAVLTMARALYLFQNGRVASKVDAANWATTHLGTKWKSLIKKALDTRGTPSFNDKELAAKFIEYTSEKSKRII